MSLWRVPLLLAVAFWATSTPSPLPAAEAETSPQSQAFKENRFLREWLLLGPISLPPEGDLDDESWQKKAFATDHLAKAGGEAEATPKAGEKVEVSDQSLEWKEITAAADSVDLAKMLASRDFAAAYAFTQVSSPDERQILLAVGSDDAVKVWLNGKLVHEHWVGRPLRQDDDLVAVTLQKGANRLLVKVQNMRGDWAFSARPLGPSQAAGRLRRAAASGELEMVKKLLELGVEVDAAQDGQLTAHQAAQLYGHSQVAKLLRERGADPERPMPSLDQWIERMLGERTKGESSGAAALVSRGGEVLFAKGYGYANLEHLVPVTPDTKFRIGSISKQFTAAAILKLQEQGRLSVEEPLAKHLPDFPRGAEVTLRHLLNHTSGIHSYTSKPEFMAKVASPVDRDTMLAWIAADPYDFEPGAKWSYNNSGFWLLGHIVEKVSGKSFEDFLKEEFFQPLGMASTGIHNTRDVLRHEAFGYSYEDGKLVKAASWNMAYAGGAGALYSTVGDLHRWNEAIFNGQALRPESLQAAFAPTRLPSDPSGEEKTSGYGYGWMIGARRGLKTIEHGGGLHGFASHLVRYPEQELTVAVLANALPPPPGLSPGEIAHEIAQFCLWEEMAPADDKPAEVAVDEETLEKYAGQYDYALAILTVTREGKRLFAQLSGQPRFEIFPKSKDEFFWKVVEAEIKFVADEQGKVVKAIHKQGGQTIEALRIEPKKAIKLDAKTLEEYVGKYDYGGRVAILTVSRDGEKLFAQLTGQPKLEIQASAKDEFFWKEVNAQVTFLRDDDGKVVKALHRQAGQKIEAPKIE